MLYASYVRLFCSVCAALNDKINYTTHNNLLLNIVFILFYIFICVCVFFLDDARRSVGYFIIVRWCMAYWWLIRNWIICMLNYLWHLAFFGFDLDYFVEGNNFFLFCLFVLMMWWFCDFIIVKLLLNYLKTHSGI